MACTGPPRLPDPERPRLPAQKSVALGSARLPGSGSLSDDRIAVDRSRVAGDPARGALDNLVVEGVVDGVPLRGQQLRAHVETLMDVTLGLSEEQAAVASHARHEDLAPDRAGFMRQ